MRQRQTALRGFTLLELLVVVAIIALAAAVTSLALPDPSQTRLEREAQRLALLLESARAHARAAGLPATWAPGPAPQTSAGRAMGEDARAPDFHFSGLPTMADLPNRWLEPGDASGGAMQVELLPARAAVSLGPEPVVPPQRIVLSLGERRIVLATDGLSPFAVLPASALEEHAR